MNPLLAAARFLVATLKGDAELMKHVTGVYPNQAKRGAKYPYIIVRFQNGKHILGVGTERVATTPLYLIKVVGEDEDIERIGRAANRMDAVLNAARGIVPALDGAGAVEVQGVYCQSPIEYPQPRADGVTLEHLGGMYSLFISPSS